MGTITMRTLSRETARVAAEVLETGRAIPVSRDGVEILWILPMSVVEQRFRAKLREHGIDPDAPAQVRLDLEPVPPTEAGQKSALDHLADERSSYYDED